MNFKNLSVFFLFGSLFVVSGCSDQPTFSFFCEKDKQGNYILKWEVSPKNCGDKVNIYMSDDDSIFTESPVITTNVDDYVVHIPTGDSYDRKFFRLKVNSTFSGVISNRHFKLDSLQNFRDIGGYFTREGLQVKWGKIFRSGELSDISPNDSKILDALKIKSIVDFRDQDERDLYPKQYKAENVFHVPILSGDRAYIRAKILEGSFLRGDAIIFTQDTYRMLVKNCADEYAKLFDVLCDEKNYPVILHGYLGKDRVGLANYFILNTLGVCSDTNEDDYLLSNSYISEHEVMGEARFLPEQMQEAATIVCQADMSYLNYAKVCMEEKSGSIEKYMEEELKITPEKRKKLREILLYR